jgi:hypothetical protein
MSDGAEGHADQRRSKGATVRPMLMEVKELHVSFCGQMFHCPAGLLEYSNQPGACGSRL